MSYQNGAPLPEFISQYHPEDADRLREGAYFNTPGPHVLTREQWELIARAAARGGTHTVRLTLTDQTTPFGDHHEGDAS